MRLFYHESIHFFVTLLIAIFVFWSFGYAQDKRWKLIAWVFVVGIFLDVDHVIDCYLATGGLNVFNTSYFVISQKAYVIFHSWELLIPWWIYIVYSKKYPLGWAVTLAFVGHLLIDQFSYNAYPLTYFLTYRIFHHFDLNQLFVIR